tara:strand:+ start:289 stop:564 length:276 start_codon:yes stop_codon:yes gene_type:complete
MADKDQQYRRKQLLSFMDFSPRNDWFPQFVQWMVDAGMGQDVARVIEKPWNYREEAGEFLDELDESETEEDWNVTDKKGNWMKKSYRKEGR